ncbi:phytanoyl-CoA dioxygenase family protein [Paenibacillus montanisoli]|uniref:Phytanoyl-CoA dioxygenase n=1 Tax=Paenibacillus montanisoli TaxID=2081970 RepID=A0A328UCX5_9BACL|nr:phytanoyl-CoA dioxygenase family protein [Paenibacillus montanisoli]RAP77896.1 hypothetical protein DL346_05420 [Paenibacillus montanisoli]
MAKDLKERYEEYKELGYTVFERLHSKETTDGWIRKYHELQQNTPRNADGTLTTWFASTCELAPLEMLPIVSHPEILDFAEMVMGPFVQLDNLTIAGGERNVSKEEARNKVALWHRDRWGKVPTTERYESPLSCNAISYMVDLDDDYGPLRVIPGSHRKPITLTDEEIFVPHKDEVIVYAKAGDVVFTHNMLLHTGTPNTSGKNRYFFSVYYNRTWLRHTDNHSGPNVQKIVQQARLRNDHRTLRLFGIDEQLEKRANSGFRVADDIQWAEWAAADKAAIKK